MPKQKCNHEHRSNRKPIRTKNSRGEITFKCPDWIKCTEVAYAKYPGEFDQWLCKAHYKERQTEWVKGYYSGLRCYMFSHVMLICLGKQKRDDKWVRVYEVQSDDITVEFTSRKTAMRYAKKINKQATKPVLNSASEQTIKTIQKLIPLNA